MRIWAIKRKWKHKFSFIFGFRLIVKTQIWIQSQGLSNCHITVESIYCCLKQFTLAVKILVLCIRLKKYLMSDNKNFISGTRHFSVCLEAARKRLRKQPHWTSRKWSEDTRRVGAYIATALSVAAAAESILIVNIFVDRKYGHKDSNIFMSRAINTQL